MSYMKARTQSMPIPIGGGEKEQFYKLSRTTTYMSPSSPVSPVSPVSLAISPPPEASPWRARFVIAARSHCPKLQLLGGAHDDQVHRLVMEACAALDGGTSPCLIDDGLGGTYFISRPNGDNLCVFKPGDEEPCALNNPKGAQQAFSAGLGRQGLRVGILVGEAALNECAAYVLDATERSRHFSRVPATANVRTEHTAFFDPTSGEGNSYDEALQCPFRVRKEKVGSLQRFVQHDGSADDFSPSLFPLLEVQRIAVLDIRLFNTDRHGGNILVQRSPQCDGSSQLRLIPIDHGFCLPDWHAALDSRDQASAPNFEWRWWAQARAPLHPAVLDYVRRMDAAADAQLLAGGVQHAHGAQHAHGGSRVARPLRAGCIRTMRIGSLLLQCAAAAGITLAQVAEIMCDPCDQTASGDLDMDAGPAPTALQKLSLLATAEAEARAHLYDTSLSAEQLDAVRDSLFYEALGAQIDGYMRGMRPLDDGVAF